MPRTLLACMTATSIGLCAITVKASPSSLVLLDQDFEQAVNFRNDGADINIKRHVNDVFDGASGSMKFAQHHTVEVLNITGSKRGSGSAAFPGKDYADPEGIGGNFVIAMLSHFQDDRLGLSFDIGELEFLNLNLNISAIDLTPGYFGGPLMAQGVAPKFRLTLWDNPDGHRRTAGTHMLSEVVIEGQPSSANQFVWTEHVEVLSAAGATNGKVILEIDLLEGGYAAFDNLRIVASDTEGDLAVGRSVTIANEGLKSLEGVPLPADARIIPDPPRSGPSGS